MQGVYPSALASFRLDRSIVKMIHRRDMPGTKLVTLCGVEVVTVWAVQETTVVLVDASVEHIDRWSALANQRERHGRIKNVHQTPKSQTLFENSVKVIRDDGICRLPGAQVQFLDRLVGIVAVIHFEDIRNRISAGIGGIDTLPAGARN